MHVRIPAFAAFSLAALAFPSLATGAACAEPPGPPRPPGSCGVVTVGASAPLNNCTTNSLKDALDCAALSCYEDIIWISNDVDGNLLPQGTVEIRDQNVEIVGGFADCDGFAGPSGYQLLSGAGGDSESVINIRGHSRVWLSHLEIAGGDEEVNDDGGGIDFKGSGSLNLSHVHLVHNRAGYGGGMLARGSAALEVVLGDDVVIADNVAYRNGGGIHASEFAHLDMRGDGLALHRNRAEGVSVTGGVEDGQGGGMYVKIPAYAAVRARAFDGFPVFLSNQARRGGAIAVTGSDQWNGSAHVNLSGFMGRGPIVLEANRASVEGGAVYLGAVATGGASSSGVVCADDTVFRGNEAPQGAVAYASAADGTLTPAEQGSFIVNDCGGGHRRCAPGMRCSEFVANRTIDANGQATDGAIVEFPGEGPGQLALHRTRFVDNVAGSLIHVGDEHDNRFEIDNCLIAGNTLSSYVIDTDADESHIRHCTIVDNMLAGTHVLRLVESADPSTSSLSTLTNSIIVQPGTLPLRHEGATDQTTIAYVLANDIRGMPANGSVFVGNPAFSNVSNGDYFLGPMSMALDYAPANVPGEEDDGVAFDLVGARRTVDVGRGDGHDGVRDLGCCEAQVLPGTALLHDGFEPRP